MRCIILVSVAVLLIVFSSQIKMHFFSSYCCLKFSQQSIAGGFTVLVEVKLADICINKMAINNYLFLR